MARICSADDATNSRIITTVNSLNTTITRATFPMKQSFLQPFLNLLKPATTASTTLPTTQGEPFFSLLGTATHLTLKPTQGLTEALYDSIDRLGIANGRLGYEIPWQQVQTGLLQAWGGMALPAPLITWFDTDDTAPSPLETIDEPEAQAHEENEGITNGYDDSTADWGMIGTALPPLVERPVTVQITLVGASSLQWQVCWVTPSQQSENITDKLLKEGVLLTAKSKQTPYVLLPYWLHQLQTLLPQAHSHYPQEPKLVAAWLQAVQQWVAQYQPQHSIVLEDKRLDSTQKRTLYFPRFELEARPSQTARASEQLADIIPFHDSLPELLGMPTHNDAVTAMQTAFRQWDGESPLLRVATHQPETFVDIALSPQQRTAFQYVKTHLTHQPDANIINAMRATGVENPLQATPNGLHIFNIDIHHYGERVIGLGEIVKSSTSFSGNSPSLFAGIDADPSAETPPSTVYVDTSLAPQPVLVLPLTDADTPIHLPPEQLPALLTAAQQAYEQGECLTVTDTVTQQKTVIDLKNQADYEAVAKQLTAAQTCWDTSPINPNRVAEQPKPPKPLPFMLQILSNDEDVAYTEDGSSHPLVNTKETLWQQLALNPKYTLFPYQQEGILWLVRSFLAQKSGVLLADDMGLGKTLQTLCFIRLLMRMLWQERVALAGLPSAVLNPETFKTGEPCTNPVLIVVPPILLENFEKQANDAFLNPEAFQFKVLHGDAIKAYKQPNKAGLRGNEVALQQPVLDMERLQREYKCIIITYNTLVNYQYSFGKISWSLVLCDEVQKAKAKNSLISVALKAVACKATFKILMSGTPIENHLGELWNIMDIATPGLLGSERTFAQTYNQTPTEATDDSAKALIFDTLNNTLKFGDFTNGFAIGRLKQDVAHNLPVLNTQTIPVPLSVETQQAITTLIHSNQLGITKANKVKQLSIHPFLSGKEKASWAAWVDASPRLQALQKILTDIHAQNEKVLIFCEYHQYQKIVQAIANHQGNHPQLVPINAQASDEDRKNILQHFERIRGFAALVLSPKCAGMGLNLQHANHVIHLTRWWNPAVEDQATCRAYRTGQQKPVFVYNFVANHPFEQNLHQRLEEKRRLRQHLFDLSYTQDVSPIACLALLE
jgi:hypothetical protein